MKMMVMALVAALMVLGCDDERTQNQTGNDTGVAGDTAATDGGADTGSADTGGADTGSADTGSGDTGSGDTGSADTGSADTGSADTGSADTSDGDADDQCAGGTLCGRPATCCPAGNECVFISATQSHACLSPCASNVRCGDDFEVCCETGELCISNACAAPTADCLDSYDCTPGEFCEPTLGKCLPQPDPLTCELVPSFSQVDVTVEWSWEDEEIISPAMVADLDGDGQPEVVVNATRVGAADWQEGQVVVLNGVTGEEIRRLTHNPPTSYGSQGRSSLALGDVSGDGLPDIIYAGDRTSGSAGPIHAVDGQGNHLWMSHDSSGTPVAATVINGAATLANFDADAEAEVVFGAMLIDNDGLVVWDAGNGAARGTNGTYTGGVSAVADLDGDGAPEIISGRDAWKVDWTGGPSAVNVTPYWSNTSINDGYPAVADMDLDGNPEVVLVASGRVIVLNGQTGELWCGVDPTDAQCVSNASLRTPSIAIPGGGIGGPPTIADFDNDGRPEIGVAGGSSYSVYDLNRSGEVVVKPTGDPDPAAGAIFVRWSQQTQDQSSNATGSSVFDFQGDGTAEVVYGDECYMRVYSGDDGTEQLRIESTSSTIHEYPIVVDVDADGNSEILIVANTADGNPPNCGSGYIGARDGIYVYGDPNDEWVPTRRVWTQHTYHVTNATSDGNVPQTEVSNWSQGALNNYRQNVQGEGVFNAPDLEVSLSTGVSGCGSSTIRLSARITNVGALGVPAGLPVTFYEGADATGTELGTVATSTILLPGGSATVTLDATVTWSAGDTKDFFVVVDGADSSGATLVEECDESNNSGATTGVFCIIN